MAMIIRPLTDLISFHRSGSSAAYEPFFSRNIGFDVGHVNGHPRLHLLQKLVAAIEGFVHQVDGLARKTRGTRRHGPPLNRRGIAGRIQNRI